MARDERTIRQTSGEPEFMFSRPLNETLYKRLRDAYTHIAIARPGEGFASIYSPDGVAIREVVVSAGEYYRINCPFCKYSRSGAADTRKRLWINHMWGVPDSSAPAGIRNSRWNLAVCYNENCLKKPEMFRALQTTVYADYHFASRQQIKVQPGVIIDPLSDEVDWPGHCIPLVELPWDHPANEYLRSRGFDPVHLSQRYDVRYCLSPKVEYSQAVNRLICPIYLNGKMVTWQARFIGEANWKFVAKYYNRRGAAKSATLYDYDVAKQYPFVILVEGYFDAWRVGNGAVALLGKTLSETQLRLIKSTWKAAVIALDDDAYYYSEEAYARLRAYMPVVRVRLPAGCDPATLPSDEFFGLVLEAAEQEGVDLFNLGVGNEFQRTDANAIDRGAERLIGF